jgi:hypothetical protein
MFILLLLACVSHTDEQTVVMEIPYCVDDLGFVNVRDCCPVGFDYVEETYDGVTILCEAGELI